MEDYHYLALTDIETNPYQPRHEFDPEKLEELAKSIRENGLIQPIIVRKSPIIGYQILAGERRFRAAKMAGLSQIPALVKTLTDDEMMRQAIIENLQRENLNPIEEAKSYQNLIDKGLTHQEIADSMGKSRPYISNSVRLLSLSPKLILALQENHLSSGHARLLLTLSNKEQEDWLEKIQKEDLSVRKLEKLLKEKKETPSPKKEKASALFIQKEEEELKQTLGLDIRIQSPNGKKGNIILSFSDLEEYQRIIHKLK